MEVQYGHETYSKGRTKMRESLRTQYREEYVKNLKREEV
jgi:hypothetical protein